MALCAGTAFSSNRSLSENRDQIEISTQDRWFQTGPTHKLDSRVFKHKPSIQGTQLSSVSHAGYV